MMVLSINPGYFDVNYRRFPSGQMTAKWWKVPTRDGPIPHHHHHHHLAMENHIF